MSGPKPEVPEGLAPPEPKNPIGEQDDRNLGLAERTPVNPLPPSGSEDPRYHFTDRSIVVSAAAAGAAFLLAPQNLKRRYLFIQNQSAENIFVDFGQRAVNGVPSIKVKPDGTLVMDDRVSFVDTSDVWVFAATAGDAICAREY